MRLLSLLLRAPSRAAEEASLLPHPITTLASAEAAPRLVSTHAPAVPTEEGPVLHGLARLLRRVVDLCGHVRSAGAVGATGLAEVSARADAVLEASRATAELTRTGSLEADELREVSAERIKAGSGTVEQGLAHLSAALAGKLDQLDEVVGLIVRVGRELDLLALNAGIQAAQAGAHGRAFSVVADQMRALARRTVENGQRVSRLLDFTDLDAEVGSFSTRTTRLFADLEAGMSTTLDRFAQRFAEIDRRIEDIAGHNRAVHDMLSLNRGAIEREAGKVEWIEAIAASIDASSMPQMRASLASTLSAERIEAASSFDRLDRIRARGVLRVAIEPSFVGLSFRLRAGEPLRGLDVDYATAFARSLGVRVEFVEHPWDQCTELLHAGARRGEAEVDVVWSALPPSASYHRVAFSDTYTWLEYVLVRRSGDSRIQGLADLEGRILGCINDPAAFATLEEAGLRWSKHGQCRDGIRLGNLIAYSDQSLIHDAVARGTVDAFAVDQPIFAWACEAADSPWRGQLEILPQPISQEPWYYAVGVADEPASLSLLAAINRFLADFRTSPDRQRIEMVWNQGGVEGSRSYRDEPGNLRGERELGTLMPAR